MNRTEKYMHMMKNSQCRNRHSTFLYLVTLSLGLILFMHLASLTGCIAEACADSTSAAMAMVAGLH